MALEWNQNGNWLATAGRDQLVKVYDIRTMKELQIFRGHKKEICCKQFNQYIVCTCCSYCIYFFIAAKWHPQHERLLATGGSDGALMFWMTGQDQPVGEQETAHESNIWSLDWHPVGHILVSGSNDHTTRFWTRPRPGELTADKFDSSQHREEEAAPVENHNRQQFIEPPPFRPHNSQQSKMEPPPFRPANMPRPPMMDGPPPFRPHNNAPPPFRPQMDNHGMMRQNQALPPQNIQHMQHQQMQPFEGGGFRPPPMNSGNRGGHGRQFGRGGGHMQQQQRYNNNNNNYNNMQHQQGYRPPPPMMNNNGNFQQRPPPMMHQQQPQQQRMNSNNNKRPYPQDNGPGYRPPPPFVGGGGGMLPPHQQQQQQQYQQLSPHKKPRRWN